MAVSACPALVGMGPAFPGWVEPGALFFEEEGRAFETGVPGLHSDASFITMVLTGLSCWNPHTTKVRCLGFRLTPVSKLVLFPGSNYFLRVTVAAEGIYNANTILTLWYVFTHSSAETEEAHIYGCSFICSFIYPAEF